MSTTNKPATTTRSTAKASPANARTTKAAPAPKEPIKGKATPKVTKPAKSEPQSLVEALTTKQASLVKVRANGTKRSLPYLAPATPERKAAEAVAARVKKGDAVTAIAEDLNVSLATARRFLTNLALARAVEAGDHDKAWSVGNKEVIVHRVEAKASQS